VPACLPVGLRVSATDWLEDDAGSDAARTGDMSDTGGPSSWTLEQCVALARALREHGASFIHVSSGGISPRQRIPIAPGYQVHLAERIRTESGLPTIAVGLVTEPEQAEAIIAEGRADFVALARAMLFNPHWPWAAAAKLGAQVEAPQQYWRSQPRGLSNLFGEGRIGQR
jgi:2,4-dienoyl-CoA reductase-like NADH-dependent reductase (Old Yellow Enzyme family)